MKRDPIYSSACSGSLHSSSFQPTLVIQFFSLFSPCFLFIKSILKSREVSYTLCSYWGHFVPQFSISTHLESALLTSFGTPPSSVILFVQWVLLVLLCYWQRLAASYATLTQLDTAHTSLSLLPRFSLFDQFVFAFQKLLTKVLFYKKLFWAGPLSFQSLPKHI